MKIFLGQIHQSDFHQDDLESIFKLSLTKKKEFAQISLKEIIQTLSDFGEFWKKNPTLHQEALLGLKEDIQFSHEMIEATLSIVPELFKKENLEKRFEAEVGEINLLDSWCHSRVSVGKVKAFPIGQLLHVTAGNVFISCIDSLIMGFLTKNISYIKLSSKNQFFPFFFAKTFIEFDKKNILADKFSILSWKGGDKKFEIPFKKHVQGIVAWGGEEMLMSLREDLPLGVKLFDYGPKISFQLLTKKGVEKETIEDLASKIATDLLMWDQQACSSPQNLFFEDGIDLDILFKSIARELDQPLFPRGELSDDESVEILKEYEKSRYAHYIQGANFLKGDTYLLAHDPEPYLRPSPLNRSLIFKKFKNIEDLIDQISPFRFYLQSCGYQVGAFEKDLYLNTMASIGIKRFAPIGFMSQGYPGLPHDGKYGMNEFVSFVSDEVILDDDRLIVHLKENVPFFKEIKAQKLNELPFTSADTVASNPLIKTNRLRSKEHLAGRIFASGGSTGNPKNVFYSNRDWERTASIFADHFKSIGPCPGDKVANLFATGSLYSSFLAVDRYLEKLGVEQLPIGGLGDIKTIVETLKLHQPTVIMGLPSLIVSYAEYCDHQKIELEIQKIYYAGEHFSESSRKYLEKIWKTKSFMSAGYATVDAGMIGFQCAQSSFGVHHVLNEAIHLEIINEEVVVTSFLREGMPVVRYRTGDRAELVEGICECGDSGLRFKLLGRVDSQINIWSCRIYLGDLEKSFISQFDFLPEYQVILKTEGHLEKMEILIHVENLSLIQRDNIYQSFYHHSEDVKKTLDISHIQKNLSLKQSEISLFAKNPRTGKTVRVQDLRV